VWLFLLLKIIVSNNNNEEEEEDDDVDDDDDDDDDDADKAAAMASANDVRQPSASDAAMDEQPQEATDDITDTDPVEGGTSTAAATAAAGISDSPEQASTGAAMDTEPTPRAAASTLTLNELPFQVQITYMDLDGAEAVRVLTQTQPVTRDRQQAETSMLPLLTVCWLLAFPPSVAEWEYKLHIVDN